MSDGVSPVWRILTALADKFARLGEHQRRLTTIVQALDHRVRLLEGVVPVSPVRAEEVERWRVRVIEDLPVAVAYAADPSTTRVDDEGLLQAPPDLAQHLCVYCGAPCSVEGRTCDAACEHAQRRRDARRARAAADAEGVGQN